MVNQDNVNSNLHILETYTVDIVQGGSAFVCCVIGDTTLGDYGSMSIHFTGCPLTRA